MSLFDRYDQNEAELFLRDTCFVPTPQRRFEDLFEQIQQHFQHTQIFSNSDDSLRIKGMKIKNANKSNGTEEIDESNIYNNTLKIDYHSDLFLENISHLLVFNVVKNKLILFYIFSYISIRMKILHCVVVLLMH
jgi:hypothetical protein